MASNPNRRKLLEEAISEGMVVTRKWLKIETGLSHHAIDNLVKSERLKLLWKRLYTRGIIDPEKYQTNIIMFSKWLTKC